MSSEFRIGSSYRHLSYAQTAATSTAQRLDALVTVPAETVTVRMQPTGAGLRFRHTTAPTANTGNLVESGVVEWPPGPVADIMVIREGETDAVLNLDFQGYRA